jgi:hypothetical protein
MLEVLSGSAKEGARALQTVPRLGSWSPTNMRLSFDWLLTTEGNAQATSLLGRERMDSPARADTSRSILLQARSAFGVTHLEMCGVGRVGCWLITRLLCVVQAMRRREHFRATHPGCC